MGTPPNTTDFTDTADVSGNADLTGTADGAGDEVPPPIPWRRVFGLLRPLRRGITGMLSLTVGGVLIGLVPPLALGVLVNALVEYNDKPEALLLAGLVALAVAAEATAYVLSDAMYARNASRLYRNIRTQMFAGALRRARRGDDTSGLPSRFISDAETIERITMSVLDMGAMTAVEFVSALVALAMLEPWSVVATLPLLLGTWVLTRRTQEPAAYAGQRRQEELEGMTRSISRELQRPDDAGATSGFQAAAERVMRRRSAMAGFRRSTFRGPVVWRSWGLSPWWSWQGSRAATTPGTLVALYLLAQRAFWGFDGVIDLSLGTKSVRGAVARCFRIIDTPARTPEPTPAVDREGKPPPPKPKALVRAA